MVNTFASHTRLTFEPLYDFKAKYSKVMKSPYRNFLICNWKIECWWWQNILKSSLKRIMYQSIPKPPIPPGQSPGIWLSYQNVCQRSETKGWFSKWAAFKGHCSCRFHVGFSVVVVLYSGICLWNMPLLKVWSEDKLNKKFVVAENFAKLASKGKRFCLYSFISWVHGMTGWLIWPSLKL